MYAIQKWGGGYKSLLKNLVGINGDYVQEICRCEKCGFIFVKNPLTKEQLDEKYKNFSKYEFDNKQTVIQQGYLRRCIDQKSFIENSINTDTYDTVLEIGAASGFNLSLYKTKTVYGIEPSKWNCENAKNNYEVNMFAGTFEEYMNSERNDKFDLIFLSHTLEHIANPCDFIKQCAKINNNYIFIEVPSFDYKVKDEPFGMFTDEHVNLFTFESLQNLMNLTGYELVNAQIPFCIGDIAPSGYPSLRTLWKKSNSIKKYKAVFTTKLLFDSYISWSEKAMDDICKKIDSIKGDKKIALWGIGNTAARILGATNLGKKNIVRAYDSDKRKHGIYFAGVEITAFDENDIKNGLIDTVIITSCTAQKALSEILNKYKNEINIVTLFEI